MTKILMTAAVISVASLATGGIAQGQTTRPDGTATTPSSTRSSATRVSATDREFVNDMTIAGNAEVQLGQLANEHAVSEDVKSFAQTIVTAHTQANEELTRLASDLNVQVPAPLDAEHKALVDRLSKLQGTEFDREFMAAMVKGHQNVADALRARVGPAQTTRALPSTLPSADAAGLQSANAGREPASTDASSGASPVATSGTSDESPALTQWAAKALPVVEQHLKRAQEIQMNLK